LSLNLLHILSLNVGPSTYKMTQFTGWWHWTNPNKSHQTWQTTCNQCLPYL